MDERQYDGHVPTMDNYHVQPIMDNYHGRDSEVRPVKLVIAGFFKTVYFLSTQHWHLSDFCCLLCATATASSNASLVPVLHPNS